MKKVAAIGLIMLMTIQCFYKLGVLGYYELNRQYIAEVLCINKEKPLSTCHGQCFLKQNLVADNQEPRAPVAGTKQQVEIPTFLISKSSIFLSHPIKASVANSRYTDSYSFDYISAAFRPPSPV